MRASFQVEPGGRLVVTGATLHDLVARAYGVQYFQVVGGDAWLSSVRFELNARTEPGMSPSGGQLNVMLVIDAAHRPTLD